MQCSANDNVLAVGPASDLKPRRECRFISLAPWRSFKKIECDTNGRQGVKTLTPPPTLPGVRQRLVVRRLEKRAVIKALFGQHSVERKECRVESMRLVSPLWNVSVTLCVFPLEVLPPFVEQDSVGVVPSSSVFAELIAAC